MRLFVFSVLGIFIGCGVTIQPQHEDDDLDPSYRTSPAASDAGDSGPVVSDAQDLLEADAGPESSVPFVYVTTTQGPDFTDNFNRVDSTDVGGGWTEKTDCFSIISNDLRQQTSGNAFDRMLLRPSDETRTNVELAA